MTGYVDCPLAKLKAADIATAVSGVVAVNNYLIVNPSQVASNRSYCASVLKLIRSEIGMQDAQLRLSIVNEIARLSGVVDAAWKAEVVEKVVRQSGILTVINEIVVR